MHAAFEFLAEQPLVLLFLLFAVGSAIGAVRVADVQIGPAAVLFTAIALGSLAAANGVKLAVPDVVGTLGLVLFTYTVGVISGPTFFAALRTGWAPIVSVASILALGAAIAAALGLRLGLPIPTIAGTFAGALTNTPALAAATERSGDAAATTVGYSISYLWGVVGMLLATAWSLRRSTPATAGTSTQLTNLTIRVERTDRPLLHDLVDRFGHGVVFSRVRHGETSPILVADEDERLEHDDLVSVVGQRDLVRQVATELGHTSSHDIVADRHDLDFRRITLSNRSLAGRTLEDLDLPGRFGAAVSRVRRGDMDMVASDDLVLQPGDRLRVIVAASRMKEVSGYLGDSERGLSDINPVGFALGVTFGVLLGTIHIPLPGGGFEIGAAGGTLLMGLIFGRVGRVGPVVTTLAHPAASALSNFGMLAFLAFAGTRAGGSFGTAVTSSLGWRIAVVGAVVTSAVAVALIVAGRVGHQLDAERLSGVIAGSQTQPAVLAFANDRTGFDNRVALGYALVYPAAMIVKILLAQVLAGLPG
ncbi:MAG: TrkA C-terminal domain-containing protein [Kineosporiaceae bacterium]